MKDHFEISVSALETSLKSTDERMRDFWEVQKPTPLKDQLNAFYSGLTEDTLPQLCETCQSLEIDDSSFGGTISDCDLTDGCQHLFFLDLPRDTYPVRDTEFMSLPVPFSRQDRLPGLPSLTASAQDGCQFCSLLISALQNRGLTVNYPVDSTVSITDAQYEWHTDLDSELRGQARHGSFLPAISLHLFSLRVQVNRSHHFKLWFRISAPPILPSVWLGIQKRPPLEFPSPDDGDGRFTFKSWLDEHIKACKACQAPTRTQYPTRLIDVGNRLSYHEDPRLVHTKDYPQIFNPEGQEPPKYLALSYCWGEISLKNMTTCENLHEHCQRIGLEDFPATCRDAILVTQSLGFRYLWIDAYCIVQDHGKEWQEESRKLSDTYSNAFLTIVPLTATSSSDGFLPARSKSARISFRSALMEQALGAYWMHEVPTDSEGYDPKDFQRRIELSSSLLDHRSADEELKRSKWVTRGWTFNEALMSPRKLKFGERSVEFECHGLQFVERAPDRGVPVADIINNYLWVQSMDRRGNAREIIGRYWTGSQYHISHRMFTRPTDRLPAISSFAQYVHEKTGDGYVAGLFRSDLHRGLTWNKNMEDKCNGFEDHLDKSFFLHGGEFYKSYFRHGENLWNCYVAPSWSWVSTPSSSYSWHAWAVSTITEADCDIEPGIELEHEDNPFGRIKSGQIVLTSKAYRSDTMQLYMEKGKLMLRDNAGFEADMDLDWILKLGPDENLQISDCPRDEHHPLWKSQGPLHDMHLVPLIQNHKRRETFGLIVIPFADPSDGFWMRAGIFKSNETWKLSENCPPKSFRVL